MPSATPQITTFSTIQHQSTPIDKVIPGISTFKNLHRSEPKSSKIGAVPLYDDLIAQVEQRRRQVLREHRVNGSRKHNGVDDEVGGTDEGTGDANTDVGKIEEYELQKYVELKKFKPNGLKDQLCEAAVVGVKLKNSSIEQILNEIVAHKDAKYVWSCIDEGDQGKVVFVRFVDDELLKNARLIRRFISIDGLKVHGIEWRTIIEENTAIFMKDADLKDSEGVDKDELMVKIEKILSSSLESKSANDDLDYQVDETELLDLPPESLPQLRKDIKEFRLKVLQNERKKRERESLEEMKRSRAQLRKLFERFKNEENQIVEDDIEDSDDSDEDEDGYDGEKLSDEQYENLRIEKENKEILQKYKDRLKIVAIEERRNRDLVDELEELNQYEGSLDKTIHPEYETGKFRPSNRDRLSELEKDELDRQQESKEKEVVEQSKNFLNTINIPFKVSLGNNNNGLNEDATSNINNEVEELEEDKLDSILEKIKPKVESYIEEFLGVKEDELLEYILMIIKENKSKENLVEELKETFDDDAVKIGDKVWTDILQEI